MNLISRKLRSKTGASMLIAILFMMFCLFVGGSVLAAASANGYRVAHMSDQQDFLSQRSASVLIADEIDNGLATLDQKLTLIVKDVAITTQPLKSLPGGGWEHEGAATTDRSILFEAPFDETNSMTVMQRLLYETAVCRYLMEYGTTGEIQLEGFYYGGSPFTFADFWYNQDPDAAQIKGTLDIEGTLQGGTAFTSDRAHFTSGARENIYDFLVTFDNSQMTVSADAYLSTAENHPESQIVYDANLGKNVEITSGGTTTEITWNHAYIQKGGAGA